MYSFLQSIKIIRIMSSYSKENNSTQQVNLSNVMNGTFLSIDENNAGRKLTELLDYLWYNHHRIPQLKQVD